MASKSKKKNKSGPSKNQYERFSAAAGLAAARAAGTSTTPEPMPRNQWGEIDWEAYHRQSRNSGQRLANEIASIAANGTRGGKTNGIQARVPSATRLPRGFGMPPSGEALPILTVEAEAPRAHGFYAVKAYDDAQVIVHRINGILTTEDPKAERAAILEILTRQPETAERVGHLLLKKARPTTEQITNYIEGFYHEAIRLIKNNARDAYRATQVFDGSPEYFWRILQRAAGVHGYSIFEPTEQAFNERAKNKFLEVVETRSTRILRFERSHAIEVFSGTRDFIESLNGAQALAEAGYYPFLSWKPSVSDQQVFANEIAEIKALENVNKVPRWLLVVNSYENPRHPERSVYSRRQSETIKPTPQPMLFAMAQAAALDTDKLDAAAIRLGLSEMEWHDLKSKYLAGEVPSRDPKWVDVIARFGKPLGRDTIK